MKIVIKSTKATLLLLFQSNRTTLYRVMPVDSRQTSTTNRLGNGGMDGKQEVLNA